MRNLVITQNITVDGSIEMLGDWFDPQDQPRKKTQISLTNCITRTARRTASS